MIKVCLSKVEQKNEISSRMRKLKKLKIMKMEII